MKLTTPDTHAVLTAAAAAHHARTVEGAVGRPVHDTVAAIARAAAALDPAHARAMIDDRAATHPDPQMREHLSAILRELYHQQQDQQKSTIVEVRQ